MSSLTPMTPVSAPGFPVESAAFARPEPLVEPPKDPITSNTAKKDAHLIRMTPEYVVDYHLLNPVESLKTAYKAFSRDQARDHELAEFDDSFRKLGSMSIAGLAVLGAATRQLRVGEAIGVVGWLAAMAITPKIINGMVWLKTGVNLNQRYLDSMHQNKPFYLDPNYLPFSLFEKQELARLGDRLNVPPGEDRQERIQDKLRSISVQARAWWMLVAGAATPILAAFTAHTLEGRVESALTRLQGAWHRFRAGSAGSAEAYVHHVDSTLATQIGAQSHLSQWWQHFGPKVAEAAGLGKTSAITLKDLDYPGGGLGKEPLLDKLAKHFGELANHGEDAMRPLREQLKQAGQALTEIESQATSYLESQLGKLSQVLDDAVATEQMASWQRRISLELTNARNTVTHYEVFLNNLSELNETVSPTAKAKIKGWLTDAELSQVYHDIERGHYFDARKIKGSTEAMLDVMNLVAFPNERFLLAAKRGAPLYVHLKSSLDQLLRRNAWRKTVLGMGGLGLLASTALYTLGVVGGLPWQRSQPQAATGLTPDRTTIPLNRGVQA